MACRLGCRRAAAALRCRDDIKPLLRSIQLVGSAAWHAGCVSSPHHVRQARLRPVCAQGCRIPVAYENYKLDKPTAAGQTHSGRLPPPPPPLPPTSLLTLLHLLPAGGAKVRLKVGGGGNGAAPRGSGGGDGGRRRRKQVRTLQASAPESNDRCAVTCSGLVLDFWPCTLLKRLCAPPAAANRKQDDDEDYEPGVEDDGDVIVISDDEAGGDEEYVVRAAL